MRPIARDEIVDYATYEDGREAFRARVLTAKHPRRVHLGEYLTLLFENPLTVRYQIQEMIRVERIVREAAVRHEIDTFNELLGGVGELGHGGVQRDPAEQVPAEQPGESDVVRGA